MCSRRSAPVNGPLTTRDTQRYPPYLPFAHLRRWLRRAATTTRYHAYSLLCRPPVGVRLACGFLFAGLVAALASGLAGLSPSQTLNQAGRFQEQLNAASTQLTTALVLLQAGQNKMHSLIEDAAVGQPYNVLLSDQSAAQSLEAQYEEQLAAFVRENLFSQHPPQAEWLKKLGQGEATGRQRGLVISVIYTWQRYHAAQSQVLQAILTGKLNAAETLAHNQADPLDADVLSALYSLMQFQSNLALSVQNAVSMQESHDQQATILIVASLALLIVLTTGLLITISLLEPLHRLRRGTQAFSTGEGEACIAVIGRDEIATISVRVNDMLAAIDSLLAEINRQHQGMISAAEQLSSDVNGQDGNAVRVKLAEMGDPLQVLEAICGEVITRFHQVSPPHGMEAQ
jgi:HAMP domain-containing protein